METLNITKEAALKAYAEAQPKQKTLLENLFGKKTFQKDILERVTTLKDVFDELGEDIQSFFDKCKAIGDEQDEVYYKVCKKICKALNGDWIPDFTNSSQPKYFIWWDLSSGEAVYFYSDFYFQGSCCSARLCFLDEKTAKHAGKYFQPEFNKYLNNR